MCNNDKYGIMYIFWVSIIQDHYGTAHHSYIFRVFYNSIPKITNILTIKPIISIYVDNEKYLTL